MAYVARHSRTHARRAAAAGLLTLVAAANARADDAGTSSVDTDGGAGWVLTLDDEFDGTSLDLCKWQFRHKWGERVVNHEQEAYVNAAEATQAFTLDNGVLHIVARKQTGVYGGETLPYTSGLLVSVQNQKYGYYEIRSRMPKGSGLWPAFWLLHVPGYPDIHEIDITEWVDIMPNDVLMTNHFGTNYDTNSLQTQFVFSATDLTTAFHVFGLDWEADRIVWYADGQQVGRITYPGQQHDMDMYLIANLAVGGDLPGDPSPEAIFPASYDIDYIRVYQRDGSDSNAAPPFGPALTIAASSAPDGGPPCGDAGTDPNDGGASDAFDTDAGDMDATGMDAAGMDAADVAAVDATASGNDASRTADAGASPSVHSGCGCTTAGRSHGSRFALPAGLAFLAIALRRRVWRSGRRFQRD